MTDIITDLCSHLNYSNNNDLIWTYDDKIDIYNKHTQYINNIEYDNIDNNTKIIDKIDIDKIVLSEELSTEINEELRPSLSTLLKEEKKYKKKNKDIITPLELIMRECDSPQISNDYIKDKIINLISQNEYIKVFGQKKAADTMSAFINNKWNKSIMLFISFLFDKKIIYNKNEVIYEKNEGTIII